MYSKWMLPMKLGVLSLLPVISGLAIEYPHTGQGLSVKENNRRVVNDDLWQGYTYCQGRTIVPGQNWHPMQNASMVKLQVMHRHGARSPGAMVPGDSTTWFQCGNPDEFMFMNQGDTISPGRSPSMKEQTVLDGPFAYTFWQGNCDLGQLTSLGSQQLQQLGQTLRSVYVDIAKFLPSQMESNFRISHTYIWRTRESVENLFNGLYPLSTRPVNETLTMHVKPSQIEIMLSPTTACPKLANLSAVYATSAAYNETLTSYTTLQNKFVAAYNTSTVKGYNNLQALYDSASAAFCHGLGLKGNLTADDIQQAVIPGTSAYHNIFRHNPNGEQVKTLAVGPWLSAILTSFHDRSTKLEVYSAHDASLDMFLSVVADPNTPWPPFAANVIIELWEKIGGGMVVRMYYEGMVVKAHPEVGCDFSGCPLETLEAFMKRYIPADFKVACAL